MQNVYVVDSRSLSTGIALLAIHAKELADNGESAQDIYNKCLQRVGYVQASFILKRVDYLYKGGRCSMLSLLGANLLKIRPQIIVKEGKMVSGKKYRGNYAHGVAKYCDDVLAEFNTPDKSLCFITYSSATPEMIDVTKKALSGVGFKKITETTDVEIPDAMIENQIDRMVQEMEYRLQYQGLRLADYLKYMNKSMEDFRKDYAEQAAEYVKSQLVIEAIIEKEEIAATDEEVEKRVEEMAKAQGKEVPDIKKNMGARQLDYIKNDIIIKKFFDLLKSSNTIE